MTYRGWMIKAIYVQAAAVNVLFGSSIFFVLFPYCTDLLVMS